MVTNVHERMLPVPPDVVGALLDSLASPEDRMWPSEHWPALRLDRPLGEGARGGHGPIRYSVSECLPGSRVGFRFAPEMGIDGGHRFEVEACPGGSVIRHVLSGRVRGPMIVLWPVALRWLHDALVEDALDNVEKALGVGPAQPARWSGYVRLLRWVFARRSGSTIRSRCAIRPVEVPPDTVALSGLPGADFTDAFAMTLPRAASHDVREWHRVLMAAGTPAWVDGLVAIRTVLARALRLQTANAMRGEGPFRVISATPDVVVAGEDDRHLDFRIVLTLGATTERPELVLSTVVRHHNAVGRAYFALVRPFHRRVVPAILRRAALRPPGDRLDRERPRARRGREGDLVSR